MPAPPPPRFLRVLLSRAVLVPVAVFAIALVVLGAVNRPSGAESEGEPTADLASIARAGSTDERIRGLQQFIAARPKAEGIWSALGLAYLQKVRETGDAGYYARAEEALDRALRRDGRDPAAVVGMGQLALARHDFSAGLDWGRRARGLQPESIRPYPVVVDALVELGRYEDATRELQQMIDLEPNLAGYARASYLRELRGDLTGAVEAMRLAVSAGAGAPENVAYVQALLGTLQFDRGRLDDAERTHRLALAGFPGHAPAEAGLAEVEAAGGELDAAIDRYQALVARLPLPEYVIALGEAQLAAGRDEAAQETFALVEVQRRLLESNGVNSDAELALFEADHGDPARAVRVARRAWEAGPSVRSADALGWALTRAGEADEGLRWARRALKLGWEDPTALYHAGMAARAADERDAAVAYLEAALKRNPDFSPLRAPKARTALEELR